MTLDKTLKLTIIVSILAVSVSVVYRLVVGPELAQRRSERLFRECLSTTVGLENNPTQEEHAWLIDLCVRSGGVDQLRKLKREMGSE